MRFFSLNFFPGPVFYSMPVQSKTRISKFTKTRKGHTKFVGTVRKSSYKFSLRYPLWGLPKFSRLTLSCSQFVWFVDRKCSSFFAELKNLRSKVLKWKLKIAIKFSYREKINGSKFTAPVMLNSSIQAVNCFSWENLRISLSVNSLISLSWSELDETAIIQIL